MEERGCRATRRRRGGEMRDSEDKENGREIVSRTF